MPYTILRFKKDKGGAIAGCERHNERKTLYLHFCKSECFNR